MSQYLGYSESELTTVKGFWTAKEIEQQPACWEKTLHIIENKQTEISSFMSKVLAHDNLRIVLTGAGTSAFAGASLAPSLSKIMKARVDAIASTDIVSNPKEYFSEDLPTLLVSFARSGNSPESVAAVDLANQCLTTCYHLILACNSEGKLYINSVNDENSLAILMPAETNDQSFAMTSSFSSMMVAAMSVLSGQAQTIEKAERFCAQSSLLVKSINDAVKEIAAHDYERVIYLGSGGLQGLAQESALKLLELTAGVVVACYDSPLGFRHGPKSIVNGKTLIIVLMSNDPYTRQYDLDLLKELRNDNTASKVIAITAQSDQAVTDGDHVLVANMETASDMELIFPYMFFPQIYAFHRAIALNNSPDSPCPSGEVNRVVQGVTIYPLTNKI